MGVLTRGAIGLAAILSLGLVGCGGGGDDTGRLQCDGTAVSADQLRLPNDFPIPDQAILTETRRAGPSQISDGYIRTGLEAAYREWKNALERAGYVVLFDEIEEEDSEIAYRSADERSTGQISLRSDCEESGRTTVHITNRPA